MHQRNIHILSFDIEDWFLCKQDKRNNPELWHKFPQRIESNSLRILSFLDELKLKAIFFVLGHIAESHPDLIREIAKRGHSIGFHSYYHCKLEHLSHTQFEKELEKGLELLEDLSGKKVMSYRAPGFSLSASSLWIIPILKKYGILYSSSIKSGCIMHSQKVPSHPFKLVYNNDSIIEFPLGRILNIPFSGSGYFRIIPEAILHQLYAQSSYLNSYFHPRDFDIDIPNSPHLPILRNWMNRIGTKGSLDKFKNIFHKQEIHSFEEAHLLATQNGGMPVLKFKAETSF